MWSAGSNASITTEGTHSDETVNSLLFATAGSITLALSGTNTITSGGILVTPDVDIQPVALSGGAIKSGVHELIVHQHNTSAAFTLASTLVNNGTASTALTKSGPGVLVLAATNLYTGDNYVNDGVLQLGAAEHCPTASSS